MDAVSNNYGIDVGFVDDFFWKVDDIVLGLFEYYSGCWEGIVIKCREFFIIRSLDRRNRIPTQHIGNRIFFTGAIVK